MSGAFPAALLRFACTHVIAEGVTKNLPPMPTVIATSSVLSRRASPRISGSVSKSLSFSPGHLVEKTCCVVMVSVLGLLHRVVAFL